MGIPIDITQVSPGLSCSLHEKTWVAGCHCLGHAFVLNFDLYRSFGLAEPRLLGKARLRTVRDVYAQGDR